MFTRNHSCDFELGLTRVPSFRSGNGAISRRCTRTEIICQLLISLVHDHFLVDVTKGAYHLIFLYPILLLPWMPCMTQMIFIYDLIFLMITKRELNFGNVKNLNRLFTLIDNLLFFVYLLRNFINFIYSLQY